MNEKRERIPGTLYEEVHAEAVRRIGGRADAFRQVKNTDKLLERIKTALKGYETNRKILDGDAQLSFDFSLEPTETQTGYVACLETTQRFVSELAALTILLAEAEFGPLGLETRMEKEEREPEQEMKARRDFGSVEAARRVGTPKAARTDREDATTV